METMTKREQVEQYNLNNPGYHITGIKTITAEQLAGYRKYGASSLYELYNNPSEAKMNSYAELLHQYDYDEVISVRGNSMTYSVLLRAGNGDLLHITHANNYLVREAK